VSGLVDVLVVFFLRAEDGIRDKLVTGVQTCALPICSSPRTKPRDLQRRISTLLLILRGALKRPAPRRRARRGPGTARRAAHLHEPPSPRSRRARTGVPRPRLGRWTWSGRIPSR